MEYFNSNKAVRNRICVPLCQISQLRKNILLVILNITVAVQNWPAVDLSELIAYHLFLRGLLTK